MEIKHVMKPNALDYTVTGKIKEIWHSVEKFNEILNTSNFLVSCSKHFQMHLFLFSF